MALVDNAWYVNYGDGSTTGYYAVAAWAALTTYDCGALRRQSAAPAVGSERVFVVIAGHVASGAAEPTWVLTRGAKTTDATITWQEATGLAGLNGDKTNTPIWSTVKNTAVTLGQLITDVAGTIYLICTTAGTAGNGAEPSWAAYTTAGATTADNTVTWTNLGVVGNFGVLAAPHARLGNAYTATWGQAGNSFFVADNHAELRTAASNFTLTDPGTAASRCKIYSFDHTVGSTPPGTGNLLAGATITQNANGLMQIIGYSYYYGLSFIQGASGSYFNSIGNLTSDLIFDTCQFKINNTTASVPMLFGTANANVPVNVSFINTTVTFGAATQMIGFFQCRFKWLNTPSAIAGATLPTTLFAVSGVSVEQADIELKGVDLSALGSGKTIVGAISSPQRYTFQDCKLGASVTLATTPASPGAAVSDFIRCDSGATNYFEARRWYQGTQDQETTIVRTGGATDGATPIAIKFVTTANSSWLSPLESLPITIWNDTVGSSITVTMYGIWGGGAVPNNDDIWIEAEYLGSTATPLGSFANSTKTNNLATGAALASDSSTWGGSTTKFAMSVTFTPQMKGSINLVVKAAKASSTFYVDPKPAISGVPVSKSHILGPGVYANELQTGMIVHPGMLGGMHG